MNAEESVQKRYKDCTMSNKRISLYIFYYNTIEQMRKHTAKLYANTLILVALFGDELYYLLGTAISRPIVRGYHFQEQGSGHQQQGQSMR